MNNLVKINNQEISLKEWNGQRVVTFADIDLVHERPKGTAKRNFSENKKRFIEGEDYILATVENTKKYEIRSLKIPTRGLTLLTETGYLMLVKSFTDDLAWTVQRSLVNNYFRNKYETNQLKFDLQEQKRKTYNGQPVLIRSELEKIFGVSNASINQIAKKHNIGVAILSGSELEKFKSENPGMIVSHISNIRLYNKDDVMKISKILNVSYDNTNDYFYEELSDYDKLWRVQLAGDIQNITRRIGKDTVYRKMLFMVASKIYMDCGLLDGIYDDLDVFNVVGNNLSVRVQNFKSKIKLQLTK